MIQIPVSHYSKNSKIPKFQFSMENFSVINLTCHRNQIIKIMINSDRCGLISVSIVYLCYSLISYLSLKVAIPAVYKENLYLVSGLFIILAFLSLWSHAAAMFIDPGNETLENSPLVSGGLPCSICGVNKSLRTHHCMVCNRCILNMDHHCPWINNCVGFKNQKHFLLFLIYTILAISWYLILIIQSAFSCKTALCLEEADPLLVYVIILSSIFAFFFMFILLISLKEQLKVIYTNTSEIDYLQCRKFVRVTVI